MIDETNEFQYFHSYIELARAGMEPMLTCACGTGYVTLIEDSRLVLWCPVEDFTVSPGVKTYRQVETAVERYLKGLK